MASITSYVGLPPARPKGAPIVNSARRVGRFPTGRCLVPASHFFELPAQSRQNQNGVYQGRRGSVLFAGLWRPCPRCRRRLHVAHDGSPSADRRSRRRSPANGGAGAAGIGAPGLIVMRRRAALLFRLAVYVLSRCVSPARVAVRGETPTRRRKSRSAGGFHSRPARATMA